MYESAENDVSLFVTLENDAKDTEDFWRKLRRLYVDGEGTCTQI